MRKLGVLTVLVGLMVVGFALTAQGVAGSQTDNCAVGDGEYKYEIDEGAWDGADPGFTPGLILSDEGEVIDVTVPAGWEVVCAKVPQPDKGAGISHFVVRATTTDTTQPEETTTTLDDTTTTTEAIEETTTTAGEETTTTDPGEDATTTTLVIVITPKGSPPDTLPFTGIENAPGLWVAGLLAIMAGAGLVWRARAE